MHTSHPFRCVGTLAGLRLHASVGSVTGALETRNKTGSAPARAD